MHFDWTAILSVLLQSITTYLVSQNHKALADHSISISSMQVLQTEHNARLARIEQKLPTRSFNG